MIKVKVKGQSFQSQFEALSKAGKERRMHELCEDLKAATPVDTGEARDGWVVEGSAIVNRVDHIESLNQGHSRQAPKHFVEQTVMAQPDVSPNGIIVRSS